MINASTGPFTVRVALSSPSFLRMPGGELCEGLVAGTMAKSGWPREAFVTTFVAFHEMTKKDGK